MYIHTVHWDIAMQSSIWPSWRRKSPGAIFTGSSLIPAWINNYIHYKVWDGITQQHNNNDNDDDNDYNNTHTRNLTLHKFVVIFSF